MHPQAAYVGCKGRFAADGQGHWVLLLLVLTRIQFEPPYNCRADPIMYFKSLRAIPQSAKVDDLNASIQ